jgi:hypothetical protein
VGEVYNKGAEPPPLLRKKGAPANFLRGSRQSLIPKILTEVILTDTD